MSIQNDQKKLVIGLFGFGVVGEGLYNMLAQTPGLHAQIKKVCIKHPEKQRNAPAGLFTTDAALLLYDEEINVIIELIDDAAVAYDIVTTAFREGKAVISANKKLIAEHLEELIALQQRCDVPFLYEAACCASIPVIRNLEEYYDNDLLQSICGIVNGSTNYILTKVGEGRSYSEALQQAQAEGFAESDPSLDVEGTDAVNKLTILLAHAYGVVTEPLQLIHTGIQNLQPADAIFAREKGYAIKLVAFARKLDSCEIAAFVLPQFIEQECRLYGIRNEYNGVIIESSLADKQFFCGKGAGGYPTASAVLSDLSALRYNYRYEYKKLQQQSLASLSNDFYLHVSLSFEAGKPKPTVELDHIYEWSRNEQGLRVSGIIHSAKLAGDDWWKQPGVSLIVYPQPVATGFVPVREVAKPEAALA